jgi:hypothetical protein
MFVLFIDCLHPGIPRLTHYVGGHRGRQEAGKGIGGEAVGMKLWVERVQLWVERVFFMCCQAGGPPGGTQCSDAHESSILAEALGLASIFLPRNRLALLEPYSITLAYCPHSFSVVPPFSTPLDAARLYSRGGRTPRRPSTRLVLDLPTRAHHWTQ